MKELIRDEIVEISSARYVGCIPTRQEITVLPADNPNHRDIGWVIFESVGVAVVNNWVFMPWYKKIFQGSFWEELFEKLSPKR
jgi:hypothetical protein